eukprot:5804658-Pyramimonas_sp.AAC.1
MSLPSAPEGASASHGSFCRPTDDIDEDEDVWDPLHLPQLPKAISTHIGSLTVPLCKRARGEILT